MVEKICRQYRLGEWSGKSYVSEWLDASDGMLRWESFRAGKKREDVAGDRGWMGS